MGIGNRTSYLVVAFAVIAGGAGVAYAVGEVLVQGNMTVVGDTTADSYQFTNPVERVIVYSERFARHSNNHLDIISKVGIAHTIPDNAKITDMECKFFDDADTGRVICRLLKADTTGSVSQVFFLETTNLFDGGDNILSGNPNETVDREIYEYSLLYDRTDCPGCDVASIKLTYTVDEAD